MRRSYRSNRGTGEARNEIKEVFRELRHLGYLARMNFWCCQTCAGYALGEVWDKKPTKKGAIYFHKQNEERYWEQGVLDIHYFGGRTGDDAEEASRKTKEVGEAIVDLLVKRGVTYRWNGSSNKTIEVFDSSEILAKTEERERQRAEEIARHAE